MLVLGRNTDDKGVQLEELTRRIMQTLGYENISLSRMGAAGEIDVTGERRIEVPGGVETFRLVCECKAKKDAIGMPDWLKFLGKILATETQTGQGVLGCFVALSGANGVVHESYDAIRKTRRITLIAEDVLLRHLAESHGLTDINKVRSTLKALTDRPYREIDVAYYDGRAYWLVLFGNGEYTLMEAGGSYVARADVETILPYVETETAASNYIDLAEEARARKEMGSAQRLVLTALMFGNGTSSLQTVADLAKGKIADEIVVQAIATLVEHKWVESEGDVIRLAADRTADVAKRAELFRFFLMGTFRVDVLGCPWWDAQIDEALLNEACRIQEGLQLTDEERAGALLFMRLSPMAFLYALTPEQLIVYHRQTHPGLTEHLAPTDRMTFKLGLRRHFIRDYKMPELAQYFAQRRGMTQMLMKSVIVVKDAAGNDVLVSPVAENNVIGELGGEFDGRFVHMRGLEPFDPPDEENPHAPALPPNPNA